MYKKLLKQFLQNLFKEIHLLDEYPMPHIPGIGSEYNNSLIKIAFIGIETNGWLNFNEFNNMSIDQYLHYSSQLLDGLEHLKWYAEGKSKYWLFIFNLLSKIYNKNIFENTSLFKSFIWANANSIEKLETIKKNNKKNTYDINLWNLIKKYSREFDNLSLIIKEYKPELVFILSWQTPENYLGTSNFFKKKYYKNIYVYKLIDSNTNIIWTWHPSSMYKDNGINSFINKINDILIIENILFS